MRESEIGIATKSSVDVKCNTPNECNKDTVTIWVHYTSAHDSLFI